MAVGGPALGTSSLEQLLDVAERARRRGRLGEARRAFTAAAEEALRRKAFPELVAASLGVGGLWVHEQRDVLDRASLHELWRRAADVVATDSLEECRLRVRRAAEQVYEGGPVSEVEDAVEGVRAHRGDRALAESLSLLHHVWLGPSRAVDRRALAEEIIRLGTRAADDELVLTGLCWRTVDLFLLGDPAAEQSLAEFRSRSAGVHDALAFVSEVLDAMLAARAGHLEEAERRATAALGRGQEAGDPDAAVYFGAMVAALRWWQGRSHEVLEAVRGLAVSPLLGLNHHVYVAANAVLSASVGDADSAEEALAKLRSIGFGALPESSALLTTLLLTVEAAHRLGDAETAEEAAERLRLHAALPVMPSLAVVCLGSARRGLGLAAAVAGRLDEAVDHLTAAVETDLRLGSRPMAAMTQHDLAAVLTARGAPQDLALAPELAARARRQADRMDMVLPAQPEWLVGGATSGSRTHQVLLEKVPGGWRIDMDGRRTVVGGLVGLHHLAELLARPGRHAMALASPLAEHLAARADPVLDATARRSIRRRVGELDARLATDGRAPSPGRAGEAYRQELEALRATLRSATGLGGRSRRFADNPERARTAVRKALVRGVDALAAAEPELGAHLRRRIETGSTCCYRPEPGWTVSVRRQPDRSPDRSGARPG